MSFKSFVERYNVIAQDIKDHNEEIDKKMREPQKEFDLLLKKLQKLSESHEEIPVALINERESVTEKIKVLFADHKEINTVEIVKSIGGTMLNDIIEKNVGIITSKSIDV